MDEQKGVWDDVCAQGAEKDVRQGLVLSSWASMEGESAQAETVDTEPKEANIGVGEVAPPGGLSASDTVDEPTCNVGKEGVVAIWGHQLVLTWRRKMTLTLANSGCS